MSIDFINNRIAHLDSYIKGIEQKLSDSVSSEGAVNFASVLDNVVDKKVKASVREDNFSQLPENFSSYITQISSQISEEYGVEINDNLVKSVIRQESGFNPNATSSAGAQGLMQLMPATARGVGVFNSLNPYQNLKGGVTYLAQMLQKFDGNLPKALAAYNAGPKAVEKYGGIPPYTETQNYVESIMRDYLNRENYQSFDYLG